MTFPSNPRLQCIITGCLLRDRVYDTVVWGDLWAGGGVYVFNAVLDEKGEAAWEGDNGDAINRKTISVDHGNCFERRGVIVIPPSANPVLNYEAQQYLNPKPVTSTTTARKPSNHVHL